MNLGQMRLEVRRALGELTADLWTDAEINDWLNEAAKLMASNCQSIQALYQLTTTASQQEYVLPDDTDEVFAVQINNSGVYPLVPVQPVQVQLGTASTGNPGYFYLRYQSIHTGNHTSSGITVANADSNSAVMRTILGLYPPPSSAYQVTVNYYSRHQKMTNDGSVPTIPVEFRRGLVAYATGLGKEKEYAYAEADRKRGEFRDFCERLREKMVSGGQEISFPLVRTDDAAVPYGDVIIKFGTAT